jgi:dipeptidyl aminopeptidase/acylaminoacyl peptidase
MARRARATSALPIPIAPALSFAGLALVAIISLGLLGGSLPTLPGGNGGNGNGDGDGGPVKTPTPSNVVITDPRADVPGSILYVKSGNIWIQTGDEARQLTDGGHDSMPAWSPDGRFVYFIRTASQKGRWPSGGIVRTYQLEVPSLVRIPADGSAEPEILLVGRFRRSGNLWSYFLRQPAVSPDGATVAVVTDGPNPTNSDIVVKLFGLDAAKLTDPGLPESRGLGHQDPAWSPDGSLLAFTRLNREGARGTPVIARYNRATGKASNVTGPGYLAPSWSPDGRYLAATRTSNFGTDVVILDARNGAELLRITNDERSFSPAWSPAGDAISFLKVQHGVVDLWVVPLDGAGPTWTAGEPLPMTVLAGLEAMSRPAWFVPADQLPPPSPTPSAPLVGPSAGAASPAS